MTDRTAAPAPADRVSTGIPGLDDILGGGLPARHMYLVEGEAGAGKTTVGLHFLLAGRDRGEKTLWITMSETERELQETARSHGWSLDGVEICNLVVSEAALKGDGKYTFFSPADVEFTDTTKAIAEAVERVKPARVVFDPFSDIKLLARDALRYRRQVLALRELLTARGCTVLLMQESARGGAGDAQAEALVHGYLTLHHDAPEYGGQRRRLLVHKMRGIGFRAGYHDFAIVPGGVEVYPRLVAAEHADAGDPVGESAASGVAELDALLGGGIERGSSLLLMGPAGVGKSSIAALYAVAAAARGERVALYLFDETVRAFRTRCEKLGMPVARLMDAGAMAVKPVDAAEFSPGQFTHAVRRAVEADGVRVVVIDSLSGYLGAMPEERFLATHLHELLSFLSHKDVVTVLTLAQHGVVGEHVQSPIDISYLADTVAILRYFEAFGAVRRAISVVKKRVGDHEPFVREVMIGGGCGVRVGAPIVEFHGVLTGRLQFTGKSGDLSAESGG